LPQDAADSNAASKSVLTIVFFINNIVNGL
jgi:hypothetical protein